MRVGARPEKRQVPGRWKGRGERHGTVFSPHDWTKNLQSFLSREARITNLEKPRGYDRDVPYPRPEPRQAGRPGHARQEGYCCPGGRERQPGKHSGSSWQILCATRCSQGKNETKLILVSLG